MTLPSFKVAVLLLVLSWSGPSAVLAFQMQRKGRAPAARVQKPLDPKADQGPETSSDASFDPKTLEKLAMIVTVDGPARNLQTNQQRVVEDEFVKILIRKGYSLVSRSDIKLVVVEQKFQQSGLTDDNAVAMGKLLNVPAVMVVRITAKGVENQQRGPMAKRAVTVARAGMGARLMSVENGLILWTGTHLESGVGPSDVHDALADVARTLAGAFPDHDPAPSSPTAKADRDSASSAARHRSFDPKGLAKLAVIMVEGLPQRNNQANAQADLPRLVEDEFVQGVMRKGYSLVSRSDIQAIAKEKAFQKSGLTEDNAAEAGKLLNVPAVLVVRITQSVVESLIDPKTRRPVSMAKAALGARLVSVESGLILWSAVHVESAPGGRGDLPSVVAAAAKTIAGDFPDKSGRIRTAAEEKADSIRAATVLKSAQNLEKGKKKEAALVYYRQVVQEFPGTPQAETAAERITELTGK